MRRSPRFKIASMLVASLGLLLPRHSEAAPPLASAGSTPLPAASAPAVIDVALAPGGRMSGQVLDRSAAPLAGRRIDIASQGRLVASCGTNATGCFTVDHLAGGLYELQCDGNLCVARLWVAGTAPPAARQTLVLTGGEVVRGQATFGPFTGDWLKGRGPWLIAAAAIVAVPTALALGLKPKSAAS